ncbi:MAG TPA: TetR/AcrR family transcriptional regulator [Xanthomonadaceae bacterium]|nr:TetR/AcrR family transcriptional regulator [Xanthomonadaceae bacterium]
MYPTRPKSAPRKPAGPAAPGRPKDPEKGSAILETAKRLFLAQGFDGVSMDQIAAEAGVSKLTVYSHYGDKETLFGAAAKAWCEQQLPSSLFEARPDVPLRERLLQVGRAFFAMVSAPEAIAGHRVLCSPQLAESPVSRLFWESGPMRIQAAFAELLAKRAAAGELEVPDPARASAQFFALLKGEAHAQLVLGCCRALPRGAAEAHIAASVDMFLRAYAPR